jgi:hypothetical protein
MQPGQLRLWNMHGVAIRTNNNLEGWHNRFSNLVATHHPNMWQLVAMIIQEQASYEVEIQQLLAGSNPSRVDRKYVRVSKRLERLHRRYNRGQLNTIQFITGIAHNLKRY